MSVNEFSADSWQASIPGLYKGLSNRNEALREAAQGLADLAGSDNISGKGADAMRAYIGEVHLPLLQSLVLSVATFQTAVGVYWDGYQAVDSGGNFRLVRDEFDEHLTQLDAGKSQLEGFSRTLDGIAAEAAHLVSIGRAGAGAADRAAGDFERLRTMVKTQCETWEAYEASDPGFNQVKELIAEVNSILSNVGNLTVGQGRDYRAGSFNLTLGRLSELMGGMQEYCSTNEKVAADGWQSLFDGYAEDVEAARKEQALWDLVWDGLQIVAGAVITVVGLGLTPFTGGVSLGLTVLGGSMVVGGVNSAINHVSIASTGQELNLIGNASDAVGKWYDVNVAQPAADSGSWGLQALAGVGSGVGSMASEAAQLNVKEMGQGVWSLATDASVRGQLWDQLKTTTGEVLAGDAYVIGEVIGSVVVPGAGAIKFSKPTGLLKKLSGEPDFGKPIKYTDPKKATSAVDGLKKPEGSDAPAVKPETPRPTGPLPKQGTPNSYGYDADGVRLPYANSRPDYAPDQVNKVWEQNRAKQLRDIEDGRPGTPPRAPGPDQMWVKDTAGDWKLIEWRPGEPRKGIWDMGHLPDAKYAQLRERYLSGEISKEEFLRIYRNEDNYRVEDPGRNQSHIDE